MKWPAFPSSTLALARALSGDHKVLKELAQDTDALHLAHQHRVMPALALQAQTRGIRGRAADAWRQSLRETSALQLVLGSSLQAAAQVLADAGIPWMPIKGMDLGTRLWSSPEQRPTSDLDLLVRPGDLERSRQAFEAAGWVGLDQSRHAEDFLRSEGYNWKARSPLGVSLELHFRLWGSSPRDLVTAVFERSQPSADLGPTGRRCLLGDAFLLAAVHTWVTPAPRPLIYWWELDLLMRDGGDELHQHVQRESRRLQIELLVGLAAAAAGRLFGSPCAALGNELLGELRWPERVLVRRLDVRSPEVLPLSQIVLSRLLARRPSRMGWRTLPRRLWAHPGVVEHHTPNHWPWPLRRLWHQTHLLSGGRLDRPLRSLLERVYPGATH